MSEPIKTRGKLERRGDWIMVQNGAYVDANPTIDAASEVLNHDPAAGNALPTAVQNALQDALTTAGCVREVEVERFFTEGYVVYDGKKPQSPLAFADSEADAMKFAAALNRLSQQTGRGE